MADGIITHQNYFQISENPHLIDNKRINCFGSQCKGKAISLPSLNFIEKYIVFLFKRPNNFSKAVCAIQLIEIYFYSILTL
jgi:hypothetical protein